MAETTASGARKDLFKLLAEVNETREPVTITSKRGDAVLVALDDYRSMQETLYLLSSPVNAEHLARSLAEFRAGQLIEAHVLDDQIELAD
jgi:antitoxin YefM